MGLGRVRACNAKRTEYALLAALLRADPAILPSDDYCGYFGLQAHGVTAALCWAHFSIAGA
jgi:hypothetical protein